MFFEQQEIFVNERPYIISYEYPEGWFEKTPSMIGAMFQVEHKLDLPLTKDNAALLFERTKLY